MPEKLQILIGADTSAARKGLADVGQHLDKLGDDAAATAAGVSKLGNRLMAISDATGKARGNAAELASSYKQLETAARQTAGRVGELNQKLVNIGAAREHAKAMTSEVDKLGNAYGKLAMAGGAMLAAGTKQFMSFDATMASVKARVEGTRKEMEQLGKTALKLGNDKRFPAFSGKDIGRGMEVLATGGLSASQINAGAAEAAALGAAAGQADIAETAQLALDVMATFNITAEDSIAVMDQLAAAANASPTSFKELGQSLSMGGAAAKALGRSSTETIAALAMLAKYMIKGSDAGTLYRTFMLSLSPTSEEAAKAMKRYGIELVDGQGRFKSMAEIAQILRDRLGGLTQAQQTAALKTMFGNDAYRMAVSLMAEGAAGMRVWETAVSKQGAAAETAAKQTDSIAGSFEALQSSIENAATVLGQSLAPTLRPAVDQLAKLVEITGEADSTTGKLARGAITTGTALGLLGFGYYKATAAVTTYRLAQKLLEKETGKVVSPLKSVHSGLTKLGTVLGGTAVAGGIATVAVTGLVLELGLLMKKGWDVKRAIDEANESLLRLNARVDDARARGYLSDAAAAAEKQDTGWGAWARRMLAPYDSLETSAPKIGAGTPGKRIRDDGEAASARQAKEAETAAGSGATGETDEEERKKKYEEWRQAEIRRLDTEIRKLRAADATAGGATKHYSDSISKMTARIQNQLRTKHKFSETKMACAGSVSGTLRDFGYLEREEWGAKRLRDQLSRDKDFRKVPVGARLDPNKLYVRYAPPAKGVEGTTGHIQWGLGGMLVGTASDNRSGRNFRYRDQGAYRTARAGDSIFEVVPKSTDREQQIRALEAQKAKLEGGAASAELQAQWAQDAKAAAEEARRLREEEVQRVIAASRSILEFYNAAVTLGEAGGQLTDRNGAAMSLEQARANRGAWQDMVAQKEALLVGLQGGDAATTLATRRAELEAERLAWSKQEAEEARRRTVEEATKAGEKLVRSAEREVELARDRAAWAVALQATETAMLDQRVAAALANEKLWAAQLAAAQQLADATGELAGLEEARHRVAVARSEAQRQEIERARQAAREADARKLDYLAGAASAAGLGLEYSGGKSAGARARYDAARLAQAREIERQELARRRAAGERSDAPVAEAEQIRADVWRDQRQRRLDAASERVGLAEVYAERAKLLGLGEQQIAQYERAVEAAKQAEAAELARQGKQLEAAQRYNDVLEAQNQRKLETASGKSASAELAVESAKLRGAGQAQLDQLQQIAWAAKQAEAAELTRQGKQLEAGKLYNEVLREQRELQAAQAREASEGARLMLERGKLLGVDTRLLERRYDLDRLREAKTLWGQGRELEAEGKLNEILRDQVERQKSLNSQLGAKAAYQAQEAGAKSLVIGGDVGINDLVQQGRLMAGTAAGANLSRPWAEVLRAIGEPNVSQFRRDLTRAVAQRDENLGRTLARVIEGRG